MNSFRAQTIGTFVRDNFTGELHPLELKASEEFVFLKRHLFLNQLNY